MLPVFPTNTWYVAGYRLTHRQLWMSHFKSPAVCVVYIGGFSRHYTPDCRTFKLVILFLCNKDTHFESYNEMQQKKIETVMYVAIKHVLLVLKVEI